MYLKSDRTLFRRRRRRPWGCVFLFLGLAVAGLALAYDKWGGMAPSSMMVGTPTLGPTATPSAAFFVAEAEAAYLKGRSAQAVDAYQQALDLEPHQTELYLALSRLLIFQNRPERGLEMARQALQRQPENARAWALLCLAYDWLGLPGQASTLCERAISLDPTLPEAYAYRAEAAIDGGQWLVANNAIATALELDETNVDVLRGRGYVLENQGNYYGAIEAYQQALEQHPRLVHLYLAIGRNAGALNNLLRARKAYEDAVAADPDSVLGWDQLGWTHLLLGDYAAARDSLETALALDPTSADAYGHMGILYFHQRNYEDAIEMFRPAVEYGEARSRRRTVSFLLTLEEIDKVGSEPQGPEFASANFIHPEHFEDPLRAEFGGVSGSSLSGRVRLDVMSGRYAIKLDGLSPAPAGKAYTGWFVDLRAPEGWVVHTAPFFPSPGGAIELDGATGVVKGPPIEYYYTYALCQYLLDRCDKAMPYIQIALRIDPQDANALRALELCQ